MRIVRYYSSGGVSTSRLAEAHGVGLATLAEGRKAVACSHPLDPKSTQSLREREWDSDAVAAEADFEPVGDATKYCWEQDCAYPFDDAGLSARYLDQG